MPRFRFARITSLTILSAVLIGTPAQPCSRILWNDNKLAVVVARTMDWPESTQPILTVFPRGIRRDVHLAIEDSSGDSAIIEYIDGKPVIHHGRQYKIMTNDPTYDEQLVGIADEVFQTLGRRGI